jgi:undecaprenyl diphosphate synthase
MHIAIIMDGSGRWANRRGLPRTFGHRAGAKAVDRVVETAVRQGIDTLTLYAFSTANWQRPKEEVGALFTLFRRYLLTQTRRCVEQSIRINVIGRRDRLSSDLCKAIEASEAATAHCSRMQLRLAVDYSAQESLVQACNRARLDERHIDRSRFLERLAEVNHAVLPAPEVDLLIRTGEERRLSDFLLWECAYAELYFTDCLWPDFDGDAFKHALADFDTRERRFGRIGDVSGTAVSHG